MPPSVWTTLSLTIQVDGRCEHGLVGASPFPRHWIYDDTGALCRKVPVADFTTWTATVCGDRTPWSGHELAAAVIGVESPLEHQLSVRIMDGLRKPTIRRLSAGQSLVRQNDPGTELFLILNGLIAVTLNGEQVAQVGPGAILGERAALSGGRRQASAIAVTDVTVASADASNFELATLQQLAAQEGGAAK